MAFLAVGMGPLAVPAESLGTLWLAFVAVHEIIPRDRGYALESLGFCGSFPLRKLARWSRIFDAFLKANRESGNAWRAGDCEPANYFRLQRRAPPPIDV